MFGSLVTLSINKMCLFLEKKNRTEIIFLGKLLVFCDIWQKRPSLVQKKKVWKEKFAENTLFLKSTRNPQTVKRAPFLNYAVNLLHEVFLTKSNVYFFVGELSSK